MIRPKKPPYLGTDISPDRTYAQIQKLLLEAGCEAVQITRSIDADVSIRFAVDIEIGGVKKRIAIELRPALLTHRKRTDGRFGSVVNAVNEGATARLAFWYLKTKLEAVQYGLVSVEREFFSQVMVALPDGRRGTVGDMAERSILNGGGVILPGVDMDHRPRQLPPGSPP